MTKNKKIIISAVVVLVLLVVYIVIDKRSKLSETTDVNNNSISTTTTTSSANTTTKNIGNTGVNVTGQGNFKVEQVGNIPEPIPDLDRKPVFGTDPSLTPEIKTAISNKIVKLQTELKNDHSLFANWINLGAYFKMAGDYNGAIIAWDYAGLLAPSNFVSFGNLGDLYGYFLKDKTKAESYYKKAIANGPTQSYLYIHLAEVYRDLFKDNAKAISIIDQGLTKIPNDKTLLDFKASIK